MNNLSAVQQEVEEDFEESSLELKRPEMLKGYTYKLEIPNYNSEMVKAYFTINDHHGKPFELFVTCDDIKLHEYLRVLMILISRLLRNHIPIKTIMEDLSVVHSGEGPHLVPGQGFCPSIAARVSSLIERHLNYIKNNK